MTLTQTYSVGLGTDFPEGQIVQRTIGGRDLIFVRSSGQIRVFDNLCSHQPVRLSEFGEVSRGHLMCHAHGGLFDIERGGAVLQGPPCDPLRAYPCQETSGLVTVTI